MDLDGEEFACRAGDLSSIPGWGRSLGGGNGNTPQYSCLENPMYRGGSGAAVHGVTKSQTGLRDQQLCYVTSVVSNPLCLCGRQPTRLPCPWDPPGKNTGAGCHALLQGIFPTQGSNLRLEPTVQADCFTVSHQETL